MILLADRYSEANNDLMIQLRFLKLARLLDFENDPSHPVILPSRASWRRPVEDFHALRK